MLRENRVVQAIEQNPAALYQLMAEHTSGGVFQSRAGLTMMSLPIPHPIFNSVLTCDLEESEIDRAVDEAVRFFEERNLPWSWTVGPSSKPQALRKGLESKGLTHAYDTPGMGIDLRGRQFEVAHDIREAKNDDSLAIWIESLPEVFGLPPETSRPFIELHAGIGWEGAPARYFYAELEGKPVAYSMCFYAAGVAGIFCVATSPEVRRQGYGEKVMHACLAASIEDGYDAAILHSSRMGVPLYEKLGFHEFCKLSYYRLG